MSWNHTLCLRPQFALKHRNYTDTRTHTYKATGAVQLGSRYVISHVSKSPRKGI